jgi:hypothetical protein
VSREYALRVWRSIRTTFVLFLVVVPLVVVANILDSEGTKDIWSDLVLPAAGLVIFAALVAEVGRRIVNAVLGAETCRWRAEP